MTNVQDRPQVAAAGKQGLAARRLLFYGVYLAVSVLVTLLRAFGAASLPQLPLEVAAVLLWGALPLIALVDALRHQQVCLAFLVRYSKPTAYFQFVVSALLVVGVGVLAYYFRWDYLSVCVGGALLALITLFAGLWQLLREPEAMAELDAARILVLAVGGLAGLTVALLGLALSWRWWEFVTSWLEVGQGKEFWRVGLAFLCILGGLAAMFVSLQFTRSEERTNPVFRRLLYGFNAVLTGLLLLAILGLVNVLVYLKAPAFFDCTATHLFSLSPRSKNVLAGLEKRTKVFVLMARKDRVYQEVETLLTNCRDVNNKIEVEFLSPDLPDEWLRKLEKRYGAERGGLLVVYDYTTREDLVDESKTVANHRFIKREDLYSLEPDMRTGSEGFKFKGEDALITEVSFLAEGRQKPVVYFTQGHGELNLNNSDPSPRARDQGMGVLRSRLEKANYEVHVLEFSPLEPKVPDNADIVVIARPQNPLPDFALTALREYMDPPDATKMKGKLMVLLDVAVTPQNTMRETGLEKLLAEYNVQVGNERVLKLPVLLGVGGDLLPASPLVLLVQPNPDLADRNPIAKEFQDEPFQVYNVRPVQPAQAGRPGGSRYSAESLLVTYPRLPVWVEPNLHADALQMGRDLLNNREEAMAKLSKAPVSVAVAVGEPDAMDPHASFRPAKVKPRLVVFGDATLASNPYTTELGGTYHFDLLRSTLDWLRERPSNIGIKPKERDTFVLKPDTNKYRMILLPAMLMFTGVIGLGTGVWLVRRR
jgi:hypothetical protein